MAAYKNLGLYWGEKSFIFVASDERLNAQLVRLPLNLDAAALDFIPPDDLHLTALIQKTLRESQFISKNISLAIPAGGTIIRAFVMPMMSPNDLGAAVEFEAKKYIPFNLKDLAYVYHSIPITENKIKKFRIIFVAIRKEIIDRQIGILKGAGLDVVSIEPASLSLIRVLLAKKVIQKNQSAAILNIIDDVCNVIFINEGIVFFVREFQIIPFGTERNEAQDPELIRNRLLNEIHNSLDFYKRQYVQVSLSEMFVISTKHINPYETWLKDDLGIPVKFIEPSDLFDAGEAGDGEMGVLEALGASFASFVKVKVDFNWRKKSSNNAFTIFPALNLSTINLAEYVNAIKTFLICAVILIMAFVMGKYLMKSDVALVERLKEEQIKYADMSQSDIQYKIDQISDRIKGYNKVRLKSSITPVFFYFAQLMPEGFWLTNFKLDYKDLKPSPENPEETLPQNPYQMRAEGSVYLKDSNQSIRAINDFLLKVKKSKELGEYFKKFSLGDLRSDDVDKHKVFFFSITGV